MTEGTDKFTMEHETNVDLMTPLQDNDKDQLLERVKTSAYGIKHLNAEAIKYTDIIKGLGVQQHDLIRVVKKIPVFIPGSSQSISDKASGIMQTMNEAYIGLQQTVCTALAAKAEFDTITKELQTLHVDIPKKTNKLIKWTPAYEKGIYRMWKEVSGLNVGDCTSNNCDIELITRTKGSILSKTSFRYELIIKTIRSRTQADTWKTVTDFCHELEMEDGRTKHWLHYPLSETFVLLVAGMLGFEFFEYQAVEHKDEYLAELRQRTGLAFAHGIPSRARYNELLGKLSADVVESVLERWADRICKMAADNPCPEMSYNPVRVHNSEIPEFAQRIRYQFQDGVVSAHFDDTGIHPESIPVKDTAAEKSVIRHIAIDGKTICGASARRKEYIHQVTAFTPVLKKILAYKTVKGKGKELQGVEELIKELGLHLGNEPIAATMDALSLNPQIINSLSDRGHSFIVGLKGNQEKLAERVKEFFKGYFQNTYGAEGTNPSGDACLYEKIQCFHDFETRKKHGRDSYWSYYHLDDVSSIFGNDFQRFNGSITSITAVIRTTIKNGEITCTTSYYVGNLDNGVLAARLIRDHWGVEAMHNILDVSFAEDKCRVHAGDRPRIFAAVRKFVMTIYFCFGNGKSINTCRSSFTSSRSYRDQILGEVYDEISYLHGSGLAFMR